MEAPLHKNTVNIGRRRFLKLGIGSAGAVIGLSYAGLLGDFIAPPPAAADYPLQKIGQMGDFPVNTPKLVSYKGQGVEEGAYVVNLGDSEGLIALDFHCTHLECGVNWVAATKQFVCPCHGGVYDIKGNVISGPPPRALYRRVVQVDDGAVRLGGRIG